MIKIPEASADLSDFPRFLNAIRKKLNLVSILLAQANLHLVISHLRDAAADSPDIQLLRKTPPCRVLQSFEPAIAGGSRPADVALAQAYRVVYVRQRPLKKMLAQNRGRSITHTAGRLTYTINAIRWVGKH